MAFAAQANFLSSQSVTANQASHVATVVGSPGVGDFCVLIIAVDNNQTTNGDEGAVSGVVDSTGANTWSKAAEFCNGRGAAQGGTTCSVWYTTLAAALSSGVHTITASFTNATSRDASAMIAYYWTMGAGSTASLEGTPATEATTATDPGSLNVTTANIECLRVRAISGETNAATGLTVTGGGWATMGGNQTGSGGATANQAVRGEYIISTGTGSASNPTWTAVDCASVYVAFKEVAAAPRVPKNLAMTMQGWLAQ